MACLKELRKEEHWGREAGVTRGQPSGGERAGSRTLGGALDINGPRVSEGREEKKEGYRFAPGWGLE